MSKYTTEVRYICEVAAGLTNSTGFDNIDTVITNAAPVIFNFDFPIFDENYRLTLEKAILLAYYTREIGEETVGLWKLRLAQVLNRVMPYYNELYKSTLWDFDPTWDVDYTIKRDSKNTSTENTTGNDDYTETRQTTGTGSSTTTQDQTTSSTDKYSDTPQGALTGLTSDNYLTNARMIDGSGDTTTNVNTSDTDTTNVTTGRDTTGSRHGDDVLDYLEKVQGYRQSPLELLRKYRELIVNINDLVIDELKDCFFGLWL